MRYKGVEKMNKRLLFVGMLAVFILVISGCGQENAIFADENKMTTPESVEPIAGGIAIPPTRIELSISKAPALGETVEIVGTVWYASKIKENMSETVANITLPEGFKLVSGNPSWRGYVKNEPQQFSITVKAVKIGNWTIEARARNLVLQGSGFDYMYISIFEDKGILTDEPPVIHKEGSDRAIKISDSSEPYKNITSDDNIITPKPISEAVINSD